jgi:hypothetical protein
MMTAVHRAIDDEHLEFLHRSAYTGGVDFQHYWKNRSWYVALNGALSHVRGDETALIETQTSSARYYQRPDNDYESLDSTRTSLTGHAGSLRLAKGSGAGNFRFETGLAWRSPGFETNDAGFMRRADEVNQFTWVGYSVRNPVGIFRRFAVNANQWLDWDFGGTNLVRRGNLNFNADFLNNWRCAAGATRTLESTSNTALRGGPSSRWPGEWDLSLQVHSDYRRRVFFNTGASFSHAGEGNYDRRNVWGGLTLRPSNALQLTFSPSYVRTEAELQYLATESFAGDDRYLFGSLDQKTAVLTVRADYTITPNLTIQLYGSPFVSAGKFSELKRITDPRAGKYEDRFHVFTDQEIEFMETDGVFVVDENADGTEDYRIDDPDFNFREFNSNLVVRWEFRPGSLLYLVWSQARTSSVSDGVFSLNDELRELFGTHPRNIFLVKVSKWFSL